MKHAVAFVIALALFLFAGCVVWFNRTALTVPLLGYSGGCLALACLIALPTDTKEALTTIGGLIPTLRARGGPPCT
jgi:hypothetical protein